MEPKAGMGATYQIGSDSYPFTVEEVVRFKSGARKGQINYIVLVQDEAIWVSGDYMGNAVYRYEPGSGYRKEARLGKDGYWHFPGSRAIITLGSREFYRDPSF